jgi:nitrite reductase/ring-hydroxylating ferredoxin subunit/uncharacterized membrane protein
MKSKASFKSHPLHPILICFPIAFFTGTVISDYISILFLKNELDYTASLLNIAGIIGGLFAALPGIIDFIYTVPPKSSGKKRAAKHGITNSVMLAVFIFAYFYRSNSTMNPYMLLALETVALILMGIAGWMGGTLVYRNQIAVDIRYAGAGKWEEETYKKAASIDIGPAGELKVNQMKLLHIGQRRIVIGRTEEKYVAFDDRCTHRGGSLAAGSMICGKVQCPWHGSQFDSVTGKNVAGPATDPINVYSIEIIDGRLILHPGD